jgi:uncharacterized protein (TIGR03546 family)
MLFTRKIGSVLRGKATPFQVMLATTLGGLLGFVPGFFLPGDLGGGFLQAPGLILLLLSLVLVLNANLAVFGLVTLAGKLLSLLLLPVSYAVGTWLLDGPLQGVYRTAINGKVTAWFGLEYYATAGGLVVGLAFGLLVGVLLNRTIHAIRVKMADVEEHSERYQKFANRKWVGITAWLVLGKGKGKKTWAELAEQKKVGMPVRIVGLIAVVVLGASLWVFGQWFSTPILTANVKSALEAANGATVDLDAATLRFTDGTVQLKRLALADSGDLTKNVLEAEELTGVIDTGELLRKRFVVDHLKSSNARAGGVRETPGVRIPGREPPPEPQPPTGTKTIEDYVKEFEVWKQRLDTVRKWIDKVAGGEGDDPGAQTPEQREQERQRQRDEVGMARVVATHLLEEGPRVLIRRIDIEGIGYSIGGKADKLDLRAANISDLPSLVADALTFDVKSQSGLMEIGLSGPSGTAKQRAAAGAGAPLSFAFALRQIPVDDVFGKLKVGGAAPLRGGTMDLTTKGSLLAAGDGRVTMELPLNVALANTTFALAGARETPVSSLVLPIGLRGPLTRPSVALDDKTLQQALLQAGQKELADFVQGQAGKLLGGLPVPVELPPIDPTNPGAALDAAKKAAEDAAKKAAEDAKKKAEDDLRRKAEEELKKKGIELPKGLPIPGIKPGGGK